MRPAHHHVDQASLLVEEAPLVSDHFMASLAIEVWLLGLDFGDGLTSVESEGRHEPQFAGRLHGLVICSAKLDLENLPLQLIDLRICFVNQLEVFSLLIGALLLKLSLLHRIRSRLPHLMDMLSNFLVGEMCEPFPDRGELRLLEEREGRLGLWCQVSFTLDSPDLCLVRFDLAKLGRGEGTFDWGCRLFAGNLLEGHDWLWLGPVFRGV